MKHILAIGKRIKCKGGGWLTHLDVDRDEPGGFSSRSIWTASTRNSLTQMHNMLLGAKRKEETP